MTYENVLETINDLLGYDSANESTAKDRSSARWKDTFLLSDMKSGITYSLESSPESPCLTNCWLTGGFDGGDWESGPEDPVEGVPEPLWESLHTVLKHLCPTITYLDYFELLKEVREGKLMVHEYYGNYKEYTYKYLSVPALDRFLVQKGYLTP